MRLARVAGVARGSGTFFCVSSFFTAFSSSLNMANTSTVFLSSVRRMASRDDRCMHTSSTSPPSSTVVTVSKTDVMTFCIITSRSLMPARKRL